MSSKTKNSEVRGHYLLMKWRGLNQCAINAFNEEKMDIPFFAIKMIVLLEVYSFCTLLFMFKNFKCNAQ